MDSKRVKRQMKFHRWLVVEVNPRVNIFQVIPADSLDEAAKIEMEIGARRSQGAEIFIAEAKLDDDGNLFWSGTDMGWPLDG